MRVDKLSDAMNFLDDDLIAQCDKVREKAASSGGSARVTSTRRNASGARVTRLWGSIAAAALVLVIGAVVITLMNSSNKKSVNMTMDKSEEHYVASREDNSPNAEVAEEIQDLSPQATSAGIEYNGAPENAEQHAGTDGGYLGETSTEAEAEPAEAVLPESDILIDPDMFIVIYAEISGGNSGVVDGESVTDLWNYIQDVTSEDNRIAVGEVYPDPEMFIALMDMQGGEVRFEVTSDGTDYILTVYSDNEAVSAFEISAEDVGVMESIVDDVLTN